MCVCAFETYNKDYLLTYLLTYLLDILEVYEVRIKSHGAEFSDFSAHVRFLSCGPSW